MENQTEISEPLNEAKSDDKALKSPEDVDASKVGCTESIFSYNFASVISYHLKLLFQYILKNIYAYL